MILIFFDVWARRNSRSRTSTACLRRILPVTLNRIGMPAAVERDAGIVDVDTFKRGREPVGIAFAAHLAIGDDIETGALLIANCNQGGIVLAMPAAISGRDALFQRLRPVRGRKTAGKPFAIDQPIGLRHGPDQRNGQQHLLNRFLAPKALVLLRCTVGETEEHRVLLSLMSYGRPGQGATNTSCSVQSNVSAPTWLRPEPSTQQ